MRQADIPGLSDRAASGDMARAAVREEGGRVMAIQSVTNTYWFRTKAEAERFRRKRDKQGKYSEVCPAGNYKGAGWIVKIVEFERVME